MRLDLTNTHTHRYKATIKICISSLTFSLLRLLPLCLKRLSVCEEDFLIKLSTHVCVCVCVWLGVHLDILGLILLAVQRVNVINVYLMKWSYQVDSINLHTDAAVVAASDKATLAAGCQCRRRWTKVPRKKHKQMPAMWQMADAK